MLAIQLNYIIGSNKQFWHLVSSVYLPKGGHMIVFDFFMKCLVD